MFNCNRGLVLPPAREQQQRPQSPGNDWLTSLSLRYLLDIHFQAGPPVFLGGAETGLFWAAPQNGNGINRHLDTDTV